VESSTVFAARRLPRIEKENAGMKAELASWLKAVMVAINGYQKNAFGAEISMENIRRTG